MISIHYEICGFVFGHQFHCLRSLRLMARKFRIQVAFETSRLASRHLESAYELVLPVARRHISKVPQADATRSFEQQKNTEKQG